MVNLNGTLVSAESKFFNHQNRGFRYGDALFETVRIVNGVPYFLEDHYFRLMSSMRILRMEIPMNFTMEFFQQELLKTVRASDLSRTVVRARFSVYREDGGYYEPHTNDIGYVIECAPLQSPFYLHNESAYEVELFKDFYVNADMLTNLKTNNKIIHTVASVFAKENGYDNCLLLNHEKKVIEAINGNVFLVNEQGVKTPPLKDGCLDGILRKKIIQILQKHPDYTITEESISPFELQKADEIFITNVIMGIQSVTRYRKKDFQSTTAQDLIGKLNAQARLGQPN
ncbi:MAG: aminotransferase class IV [Allomuricauda sp.]|nr:MAG: aminotransferase class IV [Allomuricauda sp.]